MFSYSINYRNEEETLYKGIEIFETATFLLDIIYDRQNTKKKLESIIKLNRLKKGYN